MLPSAERTEADTSAREIIITRLVRAPRDVVWQAWTQPAHVARWWGPNGFTTTFSQFDLRSGGAWRFVMHGPDGRDYLNWIAFNEVVPAQRLTYTHRGEGDDAIVFEVTVTFEEEDGGTRVTLRHLHPTPEARDQVVRERGAIEGGNQTLGRLAAYVEQA